MASEPIIITCAPTVGIHTPTMSPHLPIIPDRIARASIEAGAATAKQARERLALKGADHVGS